MKPMTQSIRNSLMVSMVLVISGCTTAPTVMPKSQQSQYPILHQAMKNASEVDHWKGCGGTFGSYAKACQAEFINQTVGPAPMLAAAMGAQKLPAGMLPLNDAMDAASIAGGALSLPHDFGGIGAGGIGLGILGILAGGSSPDLSGLHEFHSGAYLYAVHFEPNRAAANAFFAHAATVEAQVPTQMGGTIEGHTSYQFKGATWEPHEKKWHVGSGGSVGLFYKVRPASTHPVMQPFVVWETRLNPLMNAYAITDQWKLHGEATRKIGNIEAKALSSKYPDWIFVVGGGDEKPLICSAGICHSGPRLARAASLS